jgi:adenine-specific DNA methylase
MAYEPVKAKRHTAPYKIHRYFARRPWNVFRDLIKEYTDANDVILDPFMGGGVTPYEGLRANRKVLGVDTNPLSTFLVRNMVRKDIDQEKLEKATEGIIRKLNILYSGYNTVECECGHTTDIDWHEVTYIVICPSCKEETLISEENKTGRARYNCQNAECEYSEETEDHLKPKNSNRIGHEYVEQIHECEYCGERKYREVSKERKHQIQKHVEELEDKVNDDKLPSNLNIPLDWDRQKEDYLEEKNIETFSDLFTRRNLLLNYALWDEIEKYEDSEIYEPLRVIFSNSLRYTNVMTFSNKNWNSGRPNGWAKHAYWIPSQFCEMDVRKALRKSLRKYKECIEYNKEQPYTLNRADNVDEVIDKESNFFVKTSTINDIDVPDNSLDAVITDPPYGSNVQYLELSHFWYPWNKDIYDENDPSFEREAVVHRKRNRDGPTKDYSDYEELLFKVYNECESKLKDGAPLVFTFNNKDIKSWFAMLFAVFRAGFTLRPEQIIFQDGVKSYEHTAHTKASGSPYGDYIYVFEKSKDSGLNTFESDIQSVEELENYVKESYEECMQEYVDKEGVEKEKTLLEFFLDIVPKIEGYIKSGNKENRDEIYDNFRKSFFKKLYEENAGEE